MESTLQALWPVAVFGGLGALVDFLLGKTGQERTRDVLLEWWVRFEDVHWKNFGKDEALFAAKAIEHLFGQRTFSKRRCQVIISLCGFLILNGYLTKVIHDGVGFYTPQFNDHEDITSLIIAMIGVMVSISFVRIVAMKSADLIGAGILRNLILFGTFIVLNYIVFVCWVPFTFVARMTASVVVDQIMEGNVTIGTVRIVLDFLSLLPDFEIAHVSFNPKYILGVIWYNYAITPSIADISANALGTYTLHFASTSLTYLAFLARFMLAVVFIGSVVSRPLLMRPLSLIWARIIESDKPVFTLLFGGVSAIAATGLELTKHI
jgi:hypothetical protein